MLPAIKYVDCLPLHRFESVLSHHGIEISGQMVPATQCSEQLQPLLNLMSDRLLESPLIHCDETGGQVLNGLDKDPTSQSLDVGASQWRVIEKSCY